MPDHGTFEQYYLEKLKLVERVEDGVPVILNRDDPLVYDEMCIRDRSLENVAEIKVTNARRALAELSRSFFHYPDLDLFMVGVTATNGKTTTTSMVRHILQAFNIETSVIGSVAYSYGDVRVKSNLTTPESSDLHAMFAEQRDSGVKVVAMEVSSIAEAQYRVYGIE